MQRIASAGKKIALKRLFVLISFLLYITAASCAPAETASTETPAPQSLILYNWVDYMPQSVLRAFTAEYGIEVTYLTYDSMEEAVAHLRAGQIYDVVVLENNNVQPLAAEGLLVEINFQNIPNFKNISPNFRDLAFDPGNRHSIPFDYGTTGLVVRGDLVDIPVTHWADLWDPSFKGKIAVRPLAYELIGISLKSLGYPLNSENPQQLEAALQHLLELKPSLTFLDDSTSEAVQVLLSGDAVIMVGWGNDALRAAQRNAAITYVLPEEGTLLWGQSFVIPTNSPHKKTAELFLDFLLRPEISAQIVEGNRYATANQSAYPLIDPEIFTDALVFPPAEMIKKSDWYLPLRPAGEELYADIWTRFNAGHP
jgi:spermidine/putrescine transport system substrate-binding protein